MTWAACRARRELSQVRRWSRSTPWAARQQHVGEEAVDLVEREREGVGGHDGVGPRRVHRLVGEDVAREQVVERPGERRHLTDAAAGQVAEEVGHQAEDVELVDGHPVLHPVAEVRGGHPGPRREALRRVGLEPEVLAQPVGVGEVVQGDERLEAALVAGVDDGAVAGQRGVVELPVGGLATRPLDGEAEGVGAGGHDAVELLLVVVPEVERHARGLDVALGLPAEPVVAGLAGPVVPALDLEPGRGDTEEEVLGDGVALGHAWLLDG